VKLIRPDELYLLGSEHIDSSKQETGKRRPPARKRKKPTECIDTDTTCNDAIGPSGTTNDPRPRARLIKKSQQAPISADPDMQPATSPSSDTQSRTSSPEAVSSISTALIPTVNDNVKIPASNAMSSRVELTNAQLASTTERKRKRSAAAAEQTFSRKQKTTLREHDQATRQDEERSTNTLEHRGNCSLT
jgi:hypothetical protein